MIGIAFLAIGVGLLHFSNQVLEYDVDYTKCFSTLEPEKMCKDVVNSTINDLHLKNSTCRCIVDIKIEADMVCIFIFYKFFSITRFFSHSKSE